MAADDKPEEYSSAAADLKLLRVPLGSVLICGIICTVVATILLGGQGFLAGLIATLVVMGFFGIGQYIVFNTLRNNPAIAMNMALLVYVVQMGVLFLLLILLREATFFAPKAFAFSIVACALVWTGAAMMVMMRSKVLYVEPGSGPGK